MGLGVLVGKGTEVGGTVEGATGGGEEGLVAGKGRGGGGEEGLGAGREEVPTLQVGGSGQVVEDGEVPHKRATSGRGTKRERDAGEEEAQPGGKSGTQPSG